MFRFEEPAYLYLLLLLPLLAAFYLYSNYRRRKAIRKFGDPILMAQLMPDVSKYRPDVKFWMVFAAIAVLIGAGRTFGFDYYAIPALKKIWKKLPLIRKLYLYND